MKAIEYIGVCSFAPNFSRLFFSQTPLSFEVVKRLFKLLFVSFRADNVPVWIQVFQRNTCDNNSLSIKFQHLKVREVFDSPNIGYLLNCLSFPWKREKMFEINCDNVHQNSLGKIQSFAPSLCLTVRTFEKLSTKFNQWYLHYTFKSIRQRGARFMKRKSNLKLLLHKHCTPPQPSANEN